jgi:hypothetical protein
MSVKRILSIVGILALIALGFGLGVLYMIVVPDELLLSQDAVVEGVLPEASVSMLRSDAGRFIDIQPLSQDVSTIFVFYPGGLVRPQAYQWLGVALAPYGIRTLIPEFPADLAVINPNRALDVLRRAGDLPERIVIGGHSLGGAMAARFALNHADELDGLILMAAYSAESDDLSELPLNVLVLAAENDDLATPGQVTAGLQRLPADTELVLIEGAVHSFFGRYGPQRGDGVPTISRGQAEVAIIDTLRSYFNQSP